jgi:hypothetical protein
MSFRACEESPVNSVLHWGSQLQHEKGRSALAFTTTDCWVLFSIGFSDRGSTLRQIISTGDMLNHAILTRKELECSLNVLLHNGYISITDGRYFTTEKAKRFYSENKKSNEGHIAEWLRFADILQQQPALPARPIQL